MEGLGGFIFAGCLSSVIRLMFNSRVGRSFQLWHHLPVFSHSMSDGLSQRVTWFASKCGTKRSLNQWAFSLIPPFLCREGATSLTSKQPDHFQNGVAFPQLPPPRAALVGRKRSQQILVAQCRQWDSRRWFVVPIPPKTGGNLGRPRGVYHVRIFGNTNRTWMQGPSGQLCFGAQFCAEMMCHIICNMILGINKHEDNLNRTRSTLQASKHLFLEFDSLLECQSVGENPGCWPGRKGRLKTYETSTSIFCRPLCF